MNPTLPDSSLLIFESEPRIAYAASVREMPARSRSRRRCDPSTMRRAVGPRSAPGGVGLFGLGTTGTGSCGCGGLPIG
ncbi:hypothetical protein [Pseudonocardia sp. ICBG601]|uniref:hypothetical protein n=1 Tax=Pseudonocardia sp. ICBG601 TaxID=2846759 RepID=UPI001CF6211D|nr:hypothetical protein [Pseudonocardia sp. ICBG601]